ncbi:MAG: radical SAM family heme chaperone HemW, partial [Planctomycetes bacterium]|nr:radical SAM family heme chaperone HemW [Planctomycetota bacterium]
MKSADEPKSVYVHVPFCRHRCGYCDFTLVAGRDELVAAYLNALERELDSLDGSHEIDTLYLGGGTPTHLSVEQLERLFSLLAAKFHFAAHAEVSIEANPVDLSDPHDGVAKVAMLRAAGVNRISLGVQSFDAQILRTLERDHRRAEIHNAVDAVRQHFENFSLDLIFGVPGQSLNGWQDTLDEALSLAPLHVSTYGLTFEKGTAFWSRRQKGSLVTVPEETERAMYAAAMDTLTDAGFEQYELSNFAKPGRRCRHNEMYWNHQPFWGFGPGAARYIDGERRINHRSVTTWIKRTLAGESAVGETERLSAEDLARERLVIGLRKTAGIDCREFERKTGYTPWQLASAAISRHLETG